MDKKKLIVPVLVGALAGGCQVKDDQDAGPDGSPDGDDSLTGDDTETADTGPATEETEPATEETASSTQDGTEVETEADSDSDVATDTATASDTEEGDAGSCSGVTCYEAVGPAVDDIRLDLAKPGARILMTAGEARTLAGRFAERYARRSSFRILDAAGREHGAGDLGGPAVGEEIRFALSLPDTLAPGRYTLFLYGTALVNVRAYATFPARRYSVEVAGR